MEYSVYICIIMKQQFKTTAEVAHEVGLSNPENYEDMSDQLLEEEHIKNASELAESYLSGEELEEIGEMQSSFYSLFGSTVLFNVLGGVQNNFGVTREIGEEESKKSFKILASEVEELKSAMKSRDKVEILDGVVDVIIVAVGIALKEGLISVVPAALALANHNNLTKLKYDEATGKFSADIKDGKIQKPEGFVPLKLDELLPAQVFGKETKND